MKDNRPAPYPLRMPNEMRSNLESMAKNNGKSLNSELVSRLEISLLLEKPIEETFTANDARELANGSMAMRSSAFLHNCIYYIHRHAKAGETNVKIFIPINTEYDLEKDSAMYKELIHPTIEKLQELGFTVKIVKDTFIIKF